MNIADIQAAALELCQRHGWRDRNPDQRFRYLVTEVGELGKELLRYAWPGENQEDIKRRVGHEMYDVVWNLCDLANQLGIDLETCFTEKEAFNRTRVWEPEKPNDE
jgi:NTP pyrophosphatase (non-canonical NTP hydrolase)